MVPSDHFVRMYNELFKMLLQISEDALHDYWLQISRLQETIIGPYIDKKGLSGMYEYWNRIKIEENCDADLKLTENYFEFRMNHCPSLSKVLDNDASACPLYCDHCAGWIAPIMEKKGYFLVYDIISRSIPKCIMRIYSNRELAKEFAKEAKLLAEPCKQLFDN